MKDFFIMLSLVAGLGCVCSGRWDMAAVALSLAVYGQVAKLIDMHMVEDDET